MTACLSYVMDKDISYYESRLSPEVKQEHGDGTIIYGDSFYSDGCGKDIVVVETFEQLLTQVRTLDDGKLPHVPRWDDALPWVTRHVDALEMLPQYYTLVFCIITESLLNRRDYADALLIAFIEDMNKKNQFIPVYASRAEMHRLKGTVCGETKQKLLPCLFDTRHPIFMDESNAVKKLGQTLNMHLRHKKARQDQQQKDREQEIRAICRQRPRQDSDGDVAESGTSVELDSDAIATSGMRSTTKSEYYSVVVYGMANQDY